MNHKQKHQEDLEAAKSWLAIAKETNNTIAIQILEKLFPELKESEDDIKDVLKWKKVPKTWNVEDNQKVVFSEDYKYYINKKELFKKLPKE